MPPTLNKDPKTETVHPFFDASFYEGLIVNQLNVLTRIMTGRAAELTAMEEEEREKEESSKIIEQTKAKATASIKPTLIEVDK